MSYKNHILKNQLCVLPTVKKIVLVFLEKEERKERNGKGRENREREGREKKTGKLDVTAHPCNSRMVHCMQTNKHSKSRKTHAIILILAGKTFDKIQYHFMRK